MIAGGGASSGGAEVVSVVRVRKERCAVLLWRVHLRHCANGRMLCSRGIVVYAVLKEVEYFKDVVHWSWRSLAKASLGVNIFAAEVILEVFILRYI